MNRLSGVVALCGRVLLVTTAALWIQLASAQVPEQVPGDALVVVTRRTCKRSATRRPLSPSSGASSK